MLTLEQLYLHHRLMWHQTRSSTERRVSPKLRYRKGSDNLTNPVAVSLVMSMRAIVVPVCKLITKGFSGRKHLYHRDLLYYATPVFLRRVPPPLHGGFVSHTKS